MIEICSVDTGAQREWCRQLGKKKDFCLLLAWKITPSLEFATLELIDFLNSDMDSNSTQVSGIPGICVYVLVFNLHF